MKDPIVEEVRHVRKQTDVETQDNPEKFCRRLKKIEKEHSSRLYRGRPRPAHMAMAV